MATATQSSQIDKFSETSMVVGIGKTREEYLKLFSRGCISPLRDRSYVNPMSGSYDAINSSTSLILLNQRFRNSHLREQTLLEELSNSSMKEFDYESIIESVKPKIKHTKKVSSSNVSIDPYRHFESMIISYLLYFLGLSVPIQGQNKYWHNRRCTSSCVSRDLIDVAQTEPNTMLPSRMSHTTSKRSVSVSYRVPSALLKQDKSLNESQSEVDTSLTESVCQNYNDTIDQSKQSQNDFQLSPIKEASNRGVKSAGVHRRTPLTQGQQLSLLEKYHTYDIREYKVRRTNSHFQTINDRLKADFNCKPKFRLNDVRDYGKYAKYLQNPSRSANQSSCSLRSDSKKILLKPDVERSYTVNTHKIPMIILRSQESKETTSLPMQA